MTRNRRQYLNKSQRQTQQFTVHYKSHKKIFTALGNQHRLYSIINLGKQLNI